MSHKKLLIIGFSILALCVLALGLKLRVFQKEEAKVVGEHRFTTDVGYYYFTSHESKLGVLSNILDKKTLKRLPLKLGNWEGKDVSHNFPELLHYRLYINKKLDTYLWFISVYGTHESQFHTAEVCYISDGWDVSKREIRSIEIDGEQFRVRYMNALKDGETHVGVYWYMWKNTRRRMRDGTVMVRLAAELKKDEESSMHNLVDFISEFRKAEIN